MSQWLDVCSINDLQKDSGICVLVDGKQVAIFYLSKIETVYAISNYDPFGKANVLSRGLIGDINGITMVSSPLYKQHFNLENGQCMEDDSIAIAVYEVRIKTSRVEVKIEE